MELLDLVTSIITSFATIIIELITLVIIIKELLKVYIIVRFIVEVFIIDLESISFSLVFIVCYTNYD